MQIGGSEPQGGAHKQGQDTACKPASAPHKLKPHCHRLQQEEDQGSRRHVAGREQPTSPKQYEKKCGNDQLDASHSNTCWVDFLFLLFVK